MLHDEYFELKEQLEGHLDDMEGLIALLAQNDSNYRIELAKEIMRYHHSENVSAWTTCETLARGNLHVAELKHNLTVVERQLSLKEERIMAIKVIMKHIEAQIEREWSRSG
jgi:hypothetical protein